MTKRPVKVHNGNPLAGAVRRVALASIGAAALVSDELRIFGKKLIERGEIVETDGRKRYQEMTARRRNR